MEGVLLAVAAVIVTYNSAGAILSCLEALAKMAPAAEVIVIDNASRDGTVEIVRTWAQSHPRVRVIANAANRGFAAAVNQGAKVADTSGNDAGTDAEFVLLLNPDACLLTGVQTLVAASRQYGLSAGKLVDQTGEAQAGFTLRGLPTPAALICELLGVNRLWPGNPVNRKYRQLDRDLNQAGAAEQPAGAFFMIRRDAWETLGGMDELFYPVWFEDVDFCRRAVDAGYRIQYEPSAVARHEGGHSVNRIPAGSRAQYWCASLLKYAGKHFPPWAFRGVSAAVVLSSLPRMIAGIITERSVSPVAAYLKIMRFAGACLLKGKTGIS